MDYSGFQYLVAQLGEYASQHSARHKPLSPSRAVRAGETSLPGTVPALENVCACVTQASPAPILAEAYGALTHAYLGVRVAHAHPRNRSLY